MTVLLLDCGGILPESRMSDLASTSWNPSTSRRSRRPWDSASWRSVGRALSSDPGAKLLRALCFGLHLQKDGVLYFVLPCNLDALLVTANRTAGRPWRGLAIGISNAADHMLCSAKDEEHNKGQDLTPWPETSCHRRKIQDNTK